MNCDFFFWSTIFVEISWWGLLVGSDRAWHLQFQQFSITPSKKYNDWRDDLFTQAEERKRFKNEHGCWPVAGLQFLSSCLMMLCLRVCLMVVRIVGPSYVGNWESCAYGDSIASGCCCWRCWYDGTGALSCNSDESRNIVAQAAGRHFNLKQTNGLKRTWLKMLSAYNT